MKALTTLSLSHRAGLIFFITTLGAILLTFGISAYLVLLPVARTSVNDLSSLIVLSANTWQQLKGDQRHSFAEQLASNHQLRISEIPKPQAGYPSHLPYLMLLGDALEQRLGQASPIYAEDSAGRYFYTDVVIEGHTLRFRFGRSRIGTYPALTLLLALLVALSASIGVAHLAAKALTDPLRRLTIATASFRRGQAPALVPEGGPMEIAALAKDFNLMAREVLELTQNRTTLLAGVSHDLRTPIARMRMALELFRERNDPALLDKVEGYLEEMNGLIAYFLEYTQSVMTTPTPEQLELTAFLRYLADDSRLAGHPVQIEASGDNPWQGNAHALRRLLRNILENAFRFAPDSPPELKLERKEDRYIVRVLDRGPGIPDAVLDKVFQPFVRLDSSRNPGKGGVGLGLALAKELSRANGWHLYLSNRAGGGTEAVIELPMAMTETRA